MLCPSTVIVYSSPAVLSVDEWEVHMVAPAEPATSAANAITRNSTVFFILQPLPSLILPADAIAFRLYGQQ
jgi:hypothetical protein